MANNFGQPVAKPPVQTSGMKAAAGIAGKHDIKSYMEARGAKPSGTTGQHDGGYKPPKGAPKQGAGTAAGSAGNAGKARRMQGKAATSANLAGRLNSHKAAQHAAFLKGNSVPTGGGKPTGQSDFSKATMGKGPPRDSTERAKAFLDAKKAPTGGVGATSPPVQGAKTGVNPGSKPGGPTTKPPVSGGNPGAAGGKPTGASPPVSTKGTPPTTKPPIPAPAPSVGPAGGGNVNPPNPPVATSPPVAAPPTATSPPVARPPAPTPSWQQASWRNGGGTPRPPVTAPPAATAGNGHSSQPTPTPAVMPHVTPAPTPGPGAVATGTAPPSARPPLLSASTPSNALGGRQPMNVTGPGRGPSAR